jgi:large subunit ribosomal protein L36
MKVRKSLRSLKQKPGAQVVRRRGKVFVINKKNPRYKARQGWRGGGYGQHSLLDWRRDHGQAFAGSVADAD